MPENNIPLTATLGVKGVDQVEDGFRRVGKSAETMGKTTSNVAGGIKSLLGAFGIVAGAQQVITFFKTAGEEAGKDADATRLLAAQVESFGTSYDKVKGKLGDYIDKMYKLGQEDTDTTEGLTKLISRTGDINEAMKYSTLASDLASSGIHTYSENIDLLSRILQGKGVRALVDYGIEVDENATITEQLAKVQERVTRTTTEMADTSAGRIKQMKTNWGEFKEQLGSLVVFFESEFATAFNSVFSAASADKTMGGWARSVAFYVFAARRAFQDLGTLMDMQKEKAGAFGNVLEWMMKPYTIVGDLIGKALGKAGEAVKKGADSYKEEFDAYWKDIIGDTTGGDLGDRVAPVFQETSKAAQEAADNMKSAFSDMAKSVSGAIDDQIKAISDLRKEMKRLTEDTTDQADEITKKYDKMIKDETTAGNIGFRTRIAELKQERDDELAKLSKESSRKMEDLQTEELTRQKFVLEKTVQLGTPGFFDKAVAEGNTFLGSIGQGETQQSFVFNFNGDVSDIEALKKSIIDMLNRQAQLRGVGGK